MKTLVIHPKDQTTDFLSVIYDNKDWTILNTNVSKSYLKTQIKSHDRIIMLGHGTDYGLIGFDHFIINSQFVYLLRDKHCVCIWCNADVFFTKYKLKGFYTGMIISDLNESYYYSVPSSLDDIDYSNVLFAKSIKDSIDSDDMLSKTKSIYKGGNSIIDFNKQNIYST